MSAAANGPGGVPGGLASASAAATRVAELQKMIAQVEAGRGGASSPSSFGAQLAQASGGGEAAMAGASSLPAGAAAGPTGAGTAPLTATGNLSPTVPYAAQIEAAAARHGLDPALLAGLIKAESNFDPNAGSPAGAQGLTQLMPDTARGLGVTDPLDPEQAIEGGARLLSENLGKYGGDPELALAAYNAGPGAVAQYGGIPPYPETQTYVKKVLAYAAELGPGGGGGM